MTMADVNCDIHPQGKSTHLLVCSSAKCHEFFAAALTLPASVLNVRVYLDHQLVFDTVYGSGFFYFQNSTDNFYFFRCGIKLSISMSSIGNF
jgi:hypothetical protein